MTVYLGNRGFETTITEGIGTYVLEGAVQGHNTLAVSIRSLHGGSGPWRIKYFCEDGLQWECGIGILTESIPATLTREEIEDSSEDGAKVTWGPGGIRNIYISPSAAQLSSLLDEDRTDGLVIQVGRNTYETRPRPLPVADGGSASTNHVAARAAFKALEDVFLNPGELIYTQDGNTAAALPPGNSQEVLEVVDSVAGTLGWTNDPPYPPEYFTGFGYTLNSPGSDVVIQPGYGKGQLPNTINNIALTTAITKDVAVNWTEGDAGGGLPDILFPLAINTRYFIFVIRKSDGTVDAGVDTLTTAANLLAQTGYESSVCVGYFSTWDNAGVEIDYQSLVIREGDMLVQTIGSNFGGPFPTIVLPHDLGTEAFFGIVDRFRSWLENTSAGDSHGYPIGTQIPVSGNAGGGGNNSAIGLTDAYDDKNVYVSVASSGAGDVYMVVKDEVTAANCVYTPITQADWSYYARIEIQYHKSRIL